MVLASDEELAGIREALQPVYDEIASHGDNGEVLDQIVAMKEELAVPPDGIECVSIRGAGAPTTVPTSIDEASPLDGVWQVTTTEDDLAAAGDPFPVAENWGNWIYVFDRGRFAFTQENDQACTWGYGTYETVGDRVAWTFLGGGATAAPHGAFNKPGEHFVFGWN